MTEQPILRADGLKKHYVSQGGFISSLMGHSQLVKAVDGVDVELYPGETLGVVGESGCGKTTLGQTLLRLVEPTEGSIHYRPPEGSPFYEEGEIDVTSLSSSKLRDLRTDLQYIFQDPFSSLNPRLTVGDIIGEPLDIHDIASGQERTDRIYELLDVVGLNPTHAHRYPHEFSGGQRQRIGIARSLAVDPEVIICDEPVSALDVSIQAQILNLLSDLQDEFDLSYIFIAHDLGVVEHISDRVAVMYLGEVAEMGTARDVFTSPRHPYTEALLSVIPEPDPLWEGDKILLKGEVPSPINPPTGCRFHPRCHRIIQSDEYDLDQSEWRALIDLKIGVRGTESFEELVVTGGDTGWTQERDEIDEILRDAFDLPSPLSDRTAEQRLYDAMSAIRDEGLAAGAAALEDAFASPCESTRPTLTSVSDTQEVSCLLYDDSVSGSPPDSPVVADSRAVADD